MYVTVLLLLLRLNPLNALDSLSEKKMPPLVFITNEIIDYPDDYIILNSKKSAAGKTKNNKYSAIRSKSRFKKNGK